MIRTPHCWYTDTAPLVEAYPPLEGEVEADVCIVGAGITGCVAALRLAQKGLSVRVLEAQGIGFGMSGRDGGQVMGTYAAAPMPGEGGLDPEVCRVLWELGHEAVSTTQALISEQGIDCDLVMNGHLRVGTKPRHAEALKALARQWEAAGLTGLEWLDRSAIEKALGSRAVGAAVRDPNAGHLNPLKYTLGLARAAAAKGVVFHENTPYLRHGTKKADHVVVTTPRGSVRARWLILAGHAFLAERGQAPAPTALPVNTFVVATEPLGEEKAKALIPGNEGVMDLAIAPHHFRRTPDHRLLFGGIATYARIDPFNMRYPLLEAMKGFFPSLPKDMRITHAWGGPVSVTRNRLPHFGRIERNVLFVQGFSGQSVALASQAGAMMAGVVTETESRFDVVARVPHKPFPMPDRLGAPTVLLGMARLWFQDIKADRDYKRAQRAAA
ncbi:NAD(P)/FAD-dependent oxidoreductase [Pararhodospirillum oryzae]|uniref:FAD-dependent oxidoreductase n=1 Tax=Pararhodospirillum oryzae TaxID=478448 RepID=A0A512H9X0_9PROT|nr:FAD-binding oxidoreductase [Pararhodospirillum oryzae]GEO82256.1 FAD-dependent oxidoreductase [Pararhodospirillum oryzae]